jgi:MFS superfamily sulfate permease-like transporter
MSTLAQRAQIALRHDLLASIVVFLVALPLCMGIAIASGAPPAAGLITGIVGGLLVGSMAGAPLQVSGPAAGLAVVVYEIIQKHGLGMLGVILLLAGAIQLVAGLLRLGQWFRAVSPAVIHGMLAGIGVLIFVSQFHVMVDDAPRGSGIKNILALPDAVWKGVMPIDGSAHHWAAGIGLLTIVVIVGWKGLAPKKLQVVPATLLAVVCATIVAAVSGVSIKLVDVPDSITSAVTLPTAETLRGLLSGPVLIAALGMAFVASAETLLCATAVDKMHDGPRTKYDRELAAQGIGNMVCGALGALPMTGVIVRSAANVEAGAKSRASAILHGLWLLVFVAALPWVLKMIPTASLAALLVFTGFKLVNLKVVKELRQYGKGEVAIYAATLITIVATDLLTGVLTGIALSACKLLYRFAHLDIRLVDEPGRGRTVMYLDGAATFIRLPKLAAALEKVPPSTELHVHFERLQYVDHACLDLLMNWEKQHQATGGQLVIDWDQFTARFQPPAPARPEATDTDPPHGSNGKDAPDRAKELQPT